MFDKGYDLFLSDKFRNTPQTSRYPDKAALCATLWIRERRFEDARLSLTRTEPYRGPCTRPFGLDFAVARFGVGHQ